MAKYTKEQTEEAIGYLSEYFPVGTTVYTAIEHVSASGLSRDIKVYAHSATGVHHVSHLIAKALGYNRREGKDGVRVNGAGMDMGFSLVYELARVLHGDGYALKHTWL